MRSYAYLRRYRGERPGALRRIYLLTLAVEGSWLLMTGLIVLVSPDLDPSALGLGFPAGPLLAAAVGFTTVAALGQIVTGLVIRARGMPFSVVGDVALLLPSTPAERRLATFVAIGAGVSEEVFARGLLIALGVGILGFSAPVAAIAATAAFGLVHLYQGWIGVLVTTILGAVFAGLYLATESLLLPIALHIAIDVRGLLLPPHADPATYEPPGR